MSPDETPQFLTRQDGSRLAYRRIAGHGPGIVFLGGFMSDMTGAKATPLASWAARRGRSLLRFDYAGHGLSDGDFADGTIGAWADDAILALDRLTYGPQLLVGSSMGGWIMCLLARARPERVAGMVGVASAPDFTARLMEPDLDAGQRAALAAGGQVLVPSQYADEPYVITRALIEDGRRHLVLDAPLPVDAPVRLIHGTADTDVPWTLSQELLKRVTSAGATLTLVKDGDHRLSAPRDLARLVATLEDFIPLSRQ